MSVERKRGCGFRKVGGLYLVSGGQGVACDRLPIPLEVCPCCSQGFKQARGWTWVDVALLVGGVHADCHDDFACPLCMATSEMGKAGLLWIGEKFYKTPQDFDAEGAEMGISRRIKAIPRGFKVGVTWVLLAHPKTVETWVDVPEEERTAEPDVFLPGTQKRVLKPGIFKVWRPQRIEKLVLESQRDSDEVKELIEKGITPVFIPDNDKDHQGTVYDKPEEDEDETDPEKAAA
jgi:hypothetical protein